MKHCTQESHAETKADPVKWAQEITPIGELVDIDGEVLQLGNRACGSTLAREAQS